MPQQHSKAGAFLRALLVFVAVVVPAAIARINAPDLVLVLALGCAFFVYMEYEATQPLFLSFTACAPVNRLRFALIVVTLLALAGLDTSTDQGIAYELARIGAAILRLSLWLFWPELGHHLMLISGLITAVSLFGFLAVIGVLQMISWPDEGVMGKICFPLLSVRLEDLGLEQAQRQSLLAILLGFSALIFTPVLLILVDELAISGGAGAELDVLLAFWMIGSFSFIHAHAIMLYLCYRIKRLDL